MTGITESNSQIQKPVTQANISVARQSGPSQLSKPKGIKNLIKLASSREGELM